MYVSLVGCNATAAKWHNLGVPPVQKSGHEADIGGGLHKFLSAVVVSRESVLGDARNGLVCEFVSRIGQLAILGTFCDGPIKDGGGSGALSPHYSPPLPFIFVVPRTPMILIVEGVLFLQLTLTILGFPHDAPYC